MVSYLMARLRGIWFKYFPPHCKLHPEIVIDITQFAPCSKCFKLRWLSELLELINEPDKSILLNTQQEYLDCLHLSTQNIDETTHTIRDPKKSIFYEIPGTFRKLRKGVTVFLIY